MALIALKETTFEKRFIEYTGAILEGGYVFDAENIKALETAREVLKKNRQGIVMSGNPGGGKTLFFDIAHRIINPKSKRFFIKKHVFEVVAEFNMHGDHVFTHWTDKNMLFDDLGKEAMGHFYTNKYVEVMERFVSLRYQLWRSDKRITTHFTTNNSEQELLNRYGLHSLRRIKEMCEIIPIGASKEYTDRSKYKNFDSLPLVYHPLEISKEDKEWDEWYKKWREECRNTPAGTTTGETKGIGSQIKESWGKNKQPQG